MFSTLDFELPQHWEPMHGEVFKKVELQPNSTEYQNVVKGFCKTTQYNIRKVSNANTKTHFLSITNLQYSNM